MNSLSCLSRFSRDPPNVVSILIQKVNFFFRSTSTIFFFYGYYKLFVCLCPLVENASTHIIIIYFLISLS